MSKQEIQVSDFSGQQISNPDEQLVRVVVTTHPGLEPDQRAELDAMPDELRDLGRFSIAAVGLEVIRPGAEESERHVVTKNNFDKLFAGDRQADEIVAAAAVVEVVKQRAAARTSHNTRANGEPLVNYSDPQYAGLPHYGRVGKKEQQFVQANLEVVNQRRVEAGHPPIDPASTVDAERYGFPLLERAAADESTDQPQAT